MSILSNLKLVASKKKQGISPVIQRRNKLSNKIFEQIQLAQAQKDGSTYAPTRLKTYVNKQTGERKTIESVKKVRQWWHINDNGKINLFCKYGSKQIQFDAKGKNAIELSTGDELISTLVLLKDAVIAGELDEAINNASDKLRAGFVK